MELNLKSTFSYMCEKKIMGRHVTMRSSLSFYVLFEEMESYLYHYYLYVLRCDQHFPVFARALYVDNLTWKMWDSM